MSEIADNYAENIHRVNSALGSEVPIYIGDFTVTDFLAGPVWWNAEQSRRQRRAITRALGISADV